MTTAKPIGVLVVDDSASVRAAFERLLATERNIDVVGLAADPYEAVEIMRQVRPDVIILDIVMPRMDGLTFLRKIMEQHPLPVIICSAQIGSDSNQAVLALERGAVEVIPKPRVSAVGGFESSREIIVRAIRAAARARIDWRSPAAVREDAHAHRIERDAVRQPHAAAGALPSGPPRVVVIGASTGGTEALRTVFQALPLGLPGIVIAQHMPAGFTTAFASRLDQLCDLNVTEATGDDSIEYGGAILAPGNRHVRVHAGVHPRVELQDGAPVNRHRPSVDVLFRSAAFEFGPRALGILLTGMGTDGAGGLAEMYESGAETIAQDEATSVVFGMPAAAIKFGAARRILPLPDVAAAIVQWAERG